MARALSTVWSAYGAPRRQTKAVSNNLGTANSKMIRTKIQARHRPHILDDIGNGNNTNSLAVTKSPPPPLKDAPVITGINF